MTRGGQRRRDEQFTGDIPCSRGIYEWACLRAVFVAAVVTFSLVASAQGQTGQGPMTPAGGLLGSAASGLQRVNTTGPGFLYYGINAADRGLGYQGSYMTAGGFIPTIEDDLGGLWSTDIRGHLSTYAGFFSNLGLVRKQFIGGSLLGVGVYWDYDGDMNQYPEELVPGTTYVFPGGAAYNQVGVSGEWLTDWGNIRSNGYIPVGSTAFLVGPFVQNTVLCQNGVNAALGGVDLELGAYIPGLSDWAGMVSVGGYAYGNSRYTFVDGASAVPWFGGVYTRLDATFIENWDFSLQANNDSYFDWTGFARLTYRMGGSRRRNVPEQMEQPMMRNEHVVRTHQAPIAAINPANGLPWRVFHVDNLSAPGGNGTAESPFTTLAEAMARPVNAAYDIVYLRAGNSGVSPYVTPVAGYSFGAANQYLIGQGSTITIPTLSCGDRSFFTVAGSSTYPVITNPIGPAIVVNQPNVTIAHVSITNSLVGITDAGSVPAASAAVSDVLITGNGGMSRGAAITTSNGSFTFDNVRLLNLANDGIVVSAPGGDVTIVNSNISNIMGRAIAVTNSGTVTATTTRIENTTGTAIEVSGATARATLRSGTINDTIGDAVVASGSGAVVLLTDTRIASATGVGLVSSGNGSQVRATRVGLINTGTTSGASAILASGTGSIVTLDTALVSIVGGAGAVVSGETAQFFMTGGSIIENTELDGVLVTGSSATVLVEDSILRTIGGDGVKVVGYAVTSSGTAVFADTQVTVQRSRIFGVQSHGIYAEGVNGGYAVSGTTAVGSTVQVLGTQINGALLSGITALCSNVYVDRDATSRVGTNIQGTGPYGIEVMNVLPDLTTLGKSRVSVSNSTITGVANGISATSVAAGFANAVDVTIVNNSLTTSAAGINLAASDGGGSYLNANILINRITAPGSDIVLTAVAAGAVPPVAPFSPINIVNASGAANLSAINFGAVVTQAPLGWTGYMEIGRSAELPPNPPVPTVPPVP